MKTFVMILVWLTIIGCSTTLNAQTRNQEYRSVVAVKVLDMWVEGRITKDLGDKLVLRIRPDEASRLNTNEILTVYKSSIDMTRVRIRPRMNVNPSELAPDVVEFEEREFEYGGKSDLKRKRLTVTGIGLLVSGILSMVVAQGELDTNQFKAVQTILGASLGVAGVAALTLGELESEEYPQLELALLIHKQSVE
jgi:hypothetical protein